MSSYTEFAHLGVVVDDGIATVTFTPQVEGNVHRSFFTEMRDVFGALTEDPDVRAVVLTGGDSTFFAGVGRARTSRLLDAGMDAVAGQFAALQQLVQALVSFRKPLVAAVNGSAENIGGQIALLCDVAYAVESATFGDHHIAGGIAAGDGGTMLWPLLVGMARARDILLRGVSIDAAEALQLHLVAEIVAPEQLLATARRAAGELGDLPPLAYAATKLSLNRWWQLSSMVSWDQALAYEAAALVERHQR